MDPRQVKSRQRKLWDAAAPGWKKWLAVLEPAFAPVTEALLEMAEVAAGQWVLDVACGAGDTAIAAARRVGKDGRVVGIDLAPRMVAIAEERARAAGLGNVGFQELDAEELATWPEAAYEAALSRFGMSFLPQVGIALRGVHRVLTRGSRFAAAVWAAPDKVPYLRVAREAVAPFVGRALPPPDAPGAFALSTPGQLEQALSSAGFGEIRGERMTIVVEVPSAQTYADLAREAGTLGTIVAENATVSADEIWGAVAAAAAEHAGADGKIGFVCHVSCVVGRRA